MTTPNRTGTIPPQTSTRAPAAAGSGSTPAVAGMTEEVIVQGRPANPPPPMRGDEHLSEEQLRDLSEASKTTGTEAAKPNTIATTPHRGGDGSHLIVRTRGAERFSRAGLKFGKEFQVVDVGSVGEDRARAIESDPMLEARRVSKAEASRYTERADAFEAQLSTSDEHTLRSGMRDSKKRIDELEAENARLLEKYEGIGDHVPDGDARPGDEPRRGRRG